MLLCHVYRTSCYLVNHITASCRFTATGRLGCAESHKYMWFAFSAHAPLAVWSFATAQAEQRVPVNDQLISSLVFVLISYVSLSGVVNLYIRFPPLGRFVFFSPCFGPGTSPWSPPWSKKIKTKSGRSGSLSDDVYADGLALGLEPRPLRDLLRPLCKVGSKMYDFSQSARFCLNLSCLFIFSVFCVLSTSFLSRSLLFSKVGIRFKWF